MDDFDTMTVSSSLNLLKSIPCFTNLNPNALEQLLKTVRDRYFTKDEMILRESEPCPGLFILKKGSVRLYRTSLAGNEQIMRVVRAGGCFECAPLFDHGPNPVSAQTLEPSSAAFIPIGSFETLIQDYPEVVLHLIPVLAMRLRDFLNTIEDLSFKPVSSRVAKLLLQLGKREYDENQLSLSVPLTQHHLACIVGCSRQVLNSYLQELVRNDIIKIEKRNIIVLQPQMLLE